MSPDAPNRAAPVAPMPDDTHASRGTHPDLTGLPDLDPPTGFELLEVVGRGGMGVVFRARERAFDREVALKFLLGDPPPPALAVRFLDEARITGQLQHPGIPAAYRTGLSADGRPYLAMKLIKGRTLEDLLREQGTGAARWLGVFEGICQAVGYAHAHDVIHRDLKPSNVMVGAFGEVQVMDWGLARVRPPGRREPVPESSDSGNGRVSPPDRRHSVLTRVDGVRDAADRTQAGSVLGTPAYMPPEQAGGDVDAVGPPADVFGLGGILCTILTGRPPYIGPDANTTLEMAAHGDLTDAFARLEASGAEPELVALCKRCLAVNSAQRPADGSVVAKAIADLRAAADERAKRAEVDKAKAEVEVAAHRKRRRLQLVGGGLLVGVLAVGMLGTGVGYLQAEGARKEAVAAQKEEERQRIEAETQRQEVEKQKKEVEGQKAKAEAAADEERQAKAVSEAIGHFFLDDVIRQADSAKQADLKQPPNPNLTVRQALDRAADRIGERFAGQELVEAAVRDALGEAYLGIGEPAKAVPHERRAWELRKAKLGPEHLFTLRSLNDLAAVTLKAGNVTDALPLFEEAYRIRREVNGDDHSDTLLSQTNLGDSLTDADRPKEAITLLESMVARSEKSLGETHTHTLMGLNALGRAYEAAGRYADAVKVFKTAYDRRTRTQPDDHPDLLLAMVNLAAGYANVGQPAKAIPLYEAALDGRKKVLGANHPDTLTAMNNLGRTLCSAGRAAEAVPLLEDTVARWWSRDRGTVGDGSLTAMHNLASALDAVGRTTDALRMKEEVVDGFRIAAGPDHTRTLTAMNNLALSYLTAGRYDEAVSLLGEVYTRVKKVLGLGHPSTAGVRTNVITVARRGGWYDLGRTAVLDRHAQNREGMKSGSPELADEFVWVGGDLLGLRFYEEAEKFLRDGLDGPGGVRQREPNGGRVAFVESLLGGALAGRKKYEDAEPLLLKGYDGLTANRQSLTPAAQGYPFDAGQRLITLYEAWGKPEQAAEWRAKAPRETLPAPRKE